MFFMPEPGQGGFDPNSEHAQDFDAFVEKEKKERQQRIAEFEGKPGFQESMKRVENARKPIIEARNALESRIETLLAANGFDAEAVHALSQNLADVIVRGQFHDVLENLADDEDAGYVMHLKGELDKLSDESNDAWFRVGAKPNGSRYTLAEDRKALYVKAQDVLEKVGIM